MHTRPLLCAALSIAALVVPCRGQERKTRNVLFVMSDGLRWQDVFRGADPALLDKKRGGVEDLAEIRAAFWRDDARGRREALLPFVWTTVAREGQLYGNRDLKSDAFVTNGLNFSYPGYSEILCGLADPRINSNDKKPNPNRNVLEWLASKPEYAGKVAAFGAWNVIPYILNTPRPGMFVNGGYDPYTAHRSPELDLLNTLKRETAVWRDEPFDPFIARTAIEHLKAEKPRVLYVSLGETDEWAHLGRYDLYLRSAQRFDAYVRELWEAAQSMPEYRGSTTLILGVDHGRGEAPVKWKGHGQKLPDSRFVWMGFLGPDTPAMGERSGVAPVTETQVAATLAAFLGEDYRAAEPKAGKAIAEPLAGRRGASGAAAR